MADCLHLEDAPAITAEAGEEVKYSKAVTPPVPFIPDPLSMTMGWQIGSRIAAQRGRAPAAEVEA